MSSPSRPRPRALAISVLGPPASGKTALAGALSLSHGARMFRSGDFAEGRSADDDEVRGSLEALSNPRQELPERLLLRLTREAVFGPFRPQASAPVCFDGYPNSAAQTAHLITLLRSVGARLVVLELLSDQRTAWERTLPRRVCGTCDPGEDPRAAASAGAQGNCSACGGVLRLRTFPQDGAGLAERTALFQKSMRRISSELLSQGVPHHQLNARFPLHLVHDLAEVRLGWRAADAAAAATVNSR